MNDNYTRPAAVAPGDTTGVAGANVIGHSDKTIKLADGRTLGYAEYGSATGTPLFYFHGTPSSRLEPVLGMDRVAERLGVRLIAPDRPGCGLSTFQRKRNFADWPGDVLELANQLEIERFAVVGYSGGGGFAIACGAEPRLYPRLLALGVVSGVGPLYVRDAMKGMEASGLYFGSARISPWLTRLFLIMSAKAPSDKAPSQKQTKMPDVDYELLSRPGFWAKFMGCTFAESIRQGTRGPAYEASMYFKLWGFRFENVKPRVQMWYGDQDRNAPISHARYMSSRIPDCRLELLPGEGHTFIFKRFDEVVRNLVNVREKVLV